VNDPAAFLEGVYADLIVEAVKSQGPWTEIEVYIDAVNDSIQAAIDADLLRADIAHERTFSQAGDTLSTANVRARADYVPRLDQGLQATGNGDIAKYRLRRGGDRRTGWLRHRTGLDYRRRTRTQSAGTGRPVRAMLLGTVRS